MSLRTARSERVFVTVPSPIGELTVVAADAGIVALDIGRPAPPSAGRVDRRARLLVDARRQLEEWFAGERMVFDLPLAPQATPFQQRVWSELATIAFGTTTTYGDIARRIGAPRAARAVGLANGRNPIAIVVPCHRVVGGDGHLRGYAGGVERKRRLLAFEAEVLARSSVSSAKGRGTRSLSDHVHGGESRASGACTPV